MKFKTRLIIAFFTVIMVPVVLTSLFILLLGRYQISSIEKTYGLTGTTVEVLTNPVQVLGQLTVEPATNCGRRLWRIRISWRTHLSE